MSCSLIEFLNLMSASGLLAASVHATGPWQVRKIIILHFGNLVQIISVFEHWLVSLVPGSFGNCNSVFRPLLF